MAGHDLTVSFHRFEDEYADGKQLIYEDDNEEEDIPVDNGKTTTQGGTQNGVSKEASVSISNTIDHELFVDQTLNAYSEPSTHIWNFQTKLGRTRFRIHRVMDHIIARLISLLLVLTDVILISVSLGVDMDERVLEPIALGIASYFMVELGLRMFAWGKEFFKHWIEIVDMLVVVVSFVVTIAYAAKEMENKKKEGHLSRLVIIGRSIRFLLLLRLLTGRKHVEKASRQLISQNKRRYQKDGYDLDLTYITDRIIAMSFPSSGKTSIYRNPIAEVSRFFQEKYSGYFKIYNLCSEQSYETHYFEDRVERLLIDDHNVPKLSVLMEFCHDAQQWLSADSKNVIAVHCKGGKGRTGTCISAYLLFSGQFTTADKSLAYFGFRRTDRTKGRRFQGVETPSQSRYVRYVERVLKDHKGIVPVPVPVKMMAIKIYGIKDLGNGNGSDLKMDIILEKKIVYQLVFDAPVDAKVSFKPKHDGTVKVLFTQSCFPILEGDVKVMFHSSSPNVPKGYDNCAFFFWFHTSFINHNKLHLTRKELDNPHKEKSVKVFAERFSLTIKFAESHYTY